MTSKVDIINMALGFIGEPPLTSFPEDNKNSRTAAVYYDTARDKVLRDHAWNFAIKRETLSKTITTPPFEFGYQYQLPNDCLRVLYTEDQWFHRQSGEYWPYKIEGRFLYTDLDECKIKYISRVTVEGYFDPSFSIAFAHYLAYLMSMSLTEHVNQKDALLQAYVFFMSEAKFSDSQEGTAEEPEEGNWLTSRA